MVNQLKRLFSLPVFEDAEEARSAYVLKIILWTAVIVFPLILLSTFMTPVNLQLSLFVVALFAVLIVVSYIWLRNGRVGQAAWFFTITLWMLITWFAYAIQEGVGSSAYNFHTIVVFIAGVLFGWRVSLLFAGLSILTGIGFIYAEYANSIPAAIRDESVSYLLDHTVILISISALLFVTGRSTQAALKQAQQSKEEAVKDNQMARQYMAHLDVIRAANLALSQTLDLDEVLKTLLIQMKKLVPYDTATVMLRESGSIVKVRASYDYHLGPDLHRVSDIYFDAHKNPIIFALIFEEHSVLISDTDQQTGWERPSSSQTRNWFGVPLVVGGDAIGLFSASKKTPHFFTQEHLQYAESLAAQAAIAVQNAQLHQQVQQHAVELEERVAQRTAELTTNLKRTLALYQVARSVINVQSLPALLQIIADRIAETLPANRIQIYIVNVHQQRVLHFFAGGIGKELSTPIPFAQLWQGLSGWVIREQKPIFSPKGIVDVRESNFTWQYRQERQIGSVMVVPLRYQDEIFGTLTALNLPDERDFTQDDVELLRAMANQVALAIENARLFHAYRDSETRLRTVISSAPIMLWALDSDGVFTFAEGSDLAAAMFNLSDFIGQSYTEVFQGLPQMVADTQRALEGEQFTAVIHINNTILEIRYTPIFDQEGLVAGTVIVAIDITERKHVEETLRQRTAQLEGLRQISLELTAELDLETLLNSIVTKARQLLNSDSGLLYLYRPELDMLELTICHGEVYIPLGTRLRRNEGLSGKVWQKGKAVVQKDYWHWPGRISTVEVNIYVAIVAVPIQWGRDFLGVLNVAFHDPESQFAEGMELLELFAVQAAVVIYNAQMHEQIQSHAHEMEKRVVDRTRELSAANERLREMDTLKSKLIDDVSHELRTPVTNIGLYLDLMERGAAEKRPYYAQVLRVQKNRLAALIEGIITISRLHKVPLRFTAVNLNHIIEQIFESQQIKARQKGLSLSFIPETPLPFIEGDIQQLADVIIRILDNAINYTEAGSIEIATSTQEKHACLRITDTGIGIPAAEIPHLFDHFYRGKQVAQLNIPGIGLGLTIVKEIITFHSGTIDVQSELGVGSTFQLCLPIARNAPNGQTDQI